MAANVEIKTDRIIFTDATSGNLKGLRLNNDYLEAVDGGLTSLGILNALTHGTIGDRPAAGKFGRTYYVDATQETYFDNGTIWVGLSPSFNSAAYVYLGTAAQDIPTATVTKVLFDNEAYDDFNEYDSAVNHRWTATHAGKYAVSGNVRFSEDLNDGDVLRIYLYKNGGILAEGLWNKVGGAFAASTQLSVTVELIAGDYLEIHIYQASGVNRLLVVHQQATYFCINRCG